MQCILEVFDVVPRYRNFFLGEVVHGEEEGAVVLAFEFLDHGEVDDVAFVCAEEAVGGEELFGVTEGHSGFDDAAGGVEEGAVGFFCGDDDDFLGRGDHDCLVFGLEGDALGGVDDFSRGAVVFSEFYAVGVSFDGSLDAFFVIGFQDVVEGFEVEGLDGELAVACGEDDFHRLVSFLDFLGAFKSVHEGHFDVKEEDVDVRVDVQEVEDFFSVFASSDNLHAGDGGEFVFQFSSGRNFIVRYQYAYVLHGSKAPFSRLLGLLKVCWMRFHRLWPVRLLFLLQR